jgi:mannose-6-phosphate isomerase
MTSTPSAPQSGDLSPEGGTEAGPGERRPWGNYVILDDGPLAKVKRITVDPGQRLSYQQHHQRAEHWFVVAGTAIVTLDGTEHRVAPGEAIDIPLGTAHRVSNPGSDPLIFIEVQLGDYFGEDDIVRLEDDYGRAPNS